MELFKILRNYNFNSDISLQVIPRVNCSLSSGKCESSNICIARIQTSGQRKEPNLSKEVVLQVSVSSFHQEVYKNCHTFASILVLRLEDLQFATEKCVLIRMMGMERCVCVTVLIPE